MVLCYYEDVAGYSPFQPYHLLLLAPQILSHQSAGLLLAAKKFIGK